jgi:hypothetical protein
MTSPPYVHRPASATSSQAPGASPMAHSPQGASAALTSPLGGGGAAAVSSNTGRVPGGSPLVYRGGAPSQAPPPMYGHGGGGTSPNLGYTAYHGAMGGDSMKAPVKGSSACALM